jgi:hypothetical protein
VEEGDGAERPDCDGGGDNFGMHANPAMAETVLVPGVGARTAVPSGNNPRAPRVYAPGPNNGSPIETHSPAEAVLRPASSAVADAATAGSAVR